MNKISNQMEKHIRWSNEDNCFLGYLPDFIQGACCHADNEAEVYKQLQIIRESWDI